MSEQEDYKNLDTTTTEGKGWVTTDGNTGDLSDYEVTLPDRVEVVIKALGTMVVIPVFETNDVTFKKERVDSVQQPILQDENRKVAEAKLVELIRQL